MQKKALLYLTIMIAMVVLLPGYGLAKHDKGNLATIEYPEHHQQIAYQVVNVIVQLEEGADLNSFKAKLNGKKITDKFDYDDYRHRLTATLGPEDGLKVKKKKGKNKLETEIKGDKKHENKKDKDSLKFYVLDAPPPTCAELASLQLPDVTILSTEEIEAADDLPAHCKVSGFIETEINFEVLLPAIADWNRKFVMGGGGGFVGTVQNHSLTFAVNGSSLARGYATAGTDTGHSAAEFGASWAYNNPERFINFGYRAIHLTTATAKDIIRIYYDSDIQYAYFFGCSRGGGQAMVESQRYPDDFDGIIAGAPAFDWPGFAMAMAWGQQLMYANPMDLSAPTVPLSKLHLIETALLDNCDATDGLLDGLIDDPRNCTFDPSTDLPGFTTEELAAIERIYNGPSNSSGQIFLGWPYGGENDPSGWGTWIVGFENLIGPYPNLHYYFGNEILRYFVYNYPPYDLHEFNFETDVPDTAFAASVLNATDTDLSPFEGGGSKMIMWHGWSDSALSALATIDYYEGVADTMGGAENVEDFYRLFLAPGMGHCSGGPGPNLVDYLTAMEEWVENGIAPDSMTALGGDVPDRTRPLCPYPQVAVYDGDGSTDDADNFSCQEP
jgi:feruloyl esterase